MRAKGSGRMRIEESAHSCCGNATIPRTGASLVKKRYLRARIVLFRAFSLERFVFFTSWAQYSLFMIALLTLLRYLLGHHL